MGLGLGLCCCGCPTCGGLLDDPTAVFGITVAVLDITPTTLDRSTRTVYADQFSLSYQASASSASLQVFSGVRSDTNALGNYPHMRATLFLADGVAPYIVFDHKEDGSAFSFDITLVGTYPGGATYVCGDTGWTQTEHRNPVTTTRYWQMLECHGACVGNQYATWHPELPVPDSWCCPNGNLGSLGGDGCADRTSGPSTAALVVSDFGGDWAVFNGSITLNKTADIAFADYVLSNYRSADITSGGCTFAWVASIASPTNGVPSAQCAARINLSIVSGGGACTAAGAPFHELSNNLNWNWSQLGCEFGAIRGAFGGLGPNPSIGGPTSLTWAAP